MARKYRNLRSATKDALLGTGKLAAKGTEKTFKWLATNRNAGTDYLSAMLGEKWNIYCENAHSRFTDRRQKRRSDLSQRVMDGFKNADAAEIVGGWVMDFMLYMLDLLWGIIKIILIFILSILLYSVMLGVLYVIWFYLLFKLLLFILRS